MHSAATVPMDGRSPLSAAAVDLASELEHLRATCARQALVIEKLDEDVAMFRRAALALKPRNATRRRGLQPHRGSAGVAEGFEQHLPLDIRAPAAARASVRHALGGQVTPAVLGIAELVISELLSNSVRHSAAPSGDALVIVRVQLHPRTCQLEVEDPGRDGLVAPRAPDLEHGGGVGLQLVQTLSERWGVERVANHGTRVWAQIARAPAADAHGEHSRNGDRVARPAESPQTESDRRDRLAEARDEAADLRDAAAQRRDAAIATRNGDRSRRAVEAAADDRRRAKSDRRQAAADRAQARRDRLAAECDQLTGAIARGAGLRGIEHEIARARRSGEPLTLAFVDVDGLKAVNDSHGHAVGDELLRGVVAALRAMLREADLIIRYGGDEFVCVLPGATRREAARRLDLSAGVPGGLAAGSLSVGLAELHPGEDAASLVARADRALYATRGRPLEAR